MDHNNFNDYIEIRSRIPINCQIPELFEAFLNANPPARIQWRSVADYALKRSAEDSIVPFATLPDGSIVALWYCRTSPAVVYLGSEGERKAIASDFDTFLKGINRKRSGVADFDDPDGEFQIPSIAGEPNHDGLPDLQKDFEQWFADHMSLLAPVEAAAAEALRAKVHYIVEDMILDGLSKTYKYSSIHWLMNFRIEQSNVGLSLTYLDFGEWLPVPEKYQLTDVVRGLLEWVKHKDLPRYELSVDISGIVSIDRDRELVLTPPDG